MGGTGMWAAVVGRRRSRVVTVGLVAVVALAPALMVQDATAATAAPRISSASPNAGPTAGGTTVTVRGAHFARGARVLFGTTAGTRVTVSSSTRLTVRAPKHSAGAVALRVKVGSRTSAAARYTYYAPPVVTRVTPASGATGGGTAVTVTGRNFRSVSAVLFGSTRAKPRTVSSTRLTVVAPRHAAGAVSLRVVARYGTSASGTHSRYTYTVAPPAASVLHLVPSLGVLSPVAVACPAADRCVVVGERGWAQLSGTTWSPVAALPAGFAPTRLACSDTDHCLAYGEVSGDPRSAALVDGRWATPVALPDASWADVDGVELSCLATSCVILGNDFDSGQAQAARYTFGGTWATVAAPVSSEAGRSFSAETLSCTAGGCVTTGYVEDPDTLERTGYASAYDGTSWTPTAATALVVDELSCTSTTSCLGTGDASGSDDVDAPQWTVLSGTSWSAPADLGAAAEVDGLSCLSATDCTALLNRDAAAPLTGHFTGSGWTTSAAPSFGVDQMATDLACATGALCVGLFGDAVAAYRSGTWDASSAYADAPVSVSCATGTYCLSVSPLGSGQVWKDAKWVRSAATGLRETRAVSCASPTACVAIGTGAGHPALVRWNGSSWTVPLAVAGADQLVAVSCPTTAFCGAVGTVNLTVDTTAVVGVSITTAATKVSQVPGVDEVTDVSCASASLCVAVGDNYSAADDSSRLLTWNGTSWKNARSGPGDSPTVACARGTSWCLGVEYENGGQFVYSAGTWTSGHGAPSGSASVLGVDCVAKGSCFGAGDTGTPALWRYLDAWSSARHVSAPVGNSLSSLSCGTSTSCAAIPVVLQHG